jgi:hypothetical protein
LLGDGHFYGVKTGETESGAGGLNAFSNFAAQGCEDFREFAALAESFAYGAVAGEGAGAGEDQVADAGEASEGFAAGSAGYGETGDFGDASGDQGGGGVVAEAGAGSYTCGNGDYVFEGTAQLYAGEVGAGVEAEGFGREFVLDVGGLARVGEGYGEGGGLALGDFVGEAGAAQGAYGEVECGFVEAGCDDFGHAEEGAVFYARGGA